MAAQASIEEYQLDKLRKLLAEIRASNPFQQAKLKGVSQDIQSLQDFFSSCPFTSKEELCTDQAANPPYGTNLTFPPEAYTRFCRTSGTTGQSLTWLDRPEDWQWMLGNWETVFREAGCTSADRAIFPFSFGPFLGFWAAFEAAQNLGMLAIPAGGMGSHQRLQLLIQQKATVLCATPTYAIRLAEAAAEHGIDLSQSPIRKILVAGEPGGSIQEIRQKILSLWPGAQVFDHHGMTEVGPVTFQTQDSPDLLHVIETSYLAEILDPETKQPAEEGQSGELILTTLGRTGSPLLRYRTGDLVRPVQTSRGLAFQGGILGRIDDMVIIRGVNLHPAAVDATLRRVHGIAEYQVYLDTANSTLPEIRIDIEPGPGASSSIANEATEALRTQFLLRIPVNKVPEGSLPRYELKARRWNKTTNS
jgi:phenylacetate-CoA ligase